MTWLKIVAILLVIDAIVIIIKPEFLKKFLTLVSQGAKIYLAAAVKAGLGLIFLFGAGSKSSLPWLIITFGILALAGAVFIFAMPQRSRIISSWLSSRYLFTLRLMGIIYLLIAAMLVYAA